MTTDVAASVKARLLAKAHAKGEEFERSLARYASERLLYRLGESSMRQRCLLKGASLLSAWMSDTYRMTRDIDLLAFGLRNDEAIHDFLAEVCKVPCPEDGLLFDLSQLTVEPIGLDEGYVGRRARFLAYLGKARIALQVDFGTGDAVGAPTEEIEYPTILEQLPPPRVRAYPREATVAEKFEAMVQLDTRNSRMKDFHDVWALSEAFPFEGPGLVAAVAACFERRGTPWTEEAPRVLTPEFYVTPAIAARWRSYLAAGTVLQPPPAPFAVIGERISSFLGPVRKSIMQSEPLESTWRPAGPWF